MEKSASPVTLQPDAGAPAATRPWGLGATLGFSVLLAATYFAVSLVVALALTFAGLSRDPRLDVATYMHALQNNGLYLSLATLATASTGSALVVLFAKLRRGARVADYLCLRPVPARSLLRWSLVAGALAVVADLANLLFGRDVVPNFMLRAYATAGIVPLFWLAVVVAAPVFEELFFRGFLFAGVAASRLGGWGAIVLTSLAWSAAHVQYEPYDMLVVAAFGVVFGLARLRTGSTLVPLFVHALINLLATLQAAAAVGRGGG
jgi:membrane protease YdiL (CAAX protease family)